MRRKKVILVTDDLSNIGDLAIALQNVNQLTEIYGHVLVRLWTQIHPDVARQITSSGAKLISGKSLAYLGAILGRCDMVVAGGQIVRSNVSVLSLANLIVTAGLVRLRGGTVEARGIGVSDISQPWVRWIWSLFLRLCHNINVRDDTSLALLSRLLGFPKLSRTSDMVFTSGYIHDRLTQYASERRRRVIVAPCSDQRESRSMAGSGLTAVMAAVDRLLDSPQVKIVCHDPRPGMDIQAAASLSDNMGHSASDVMADYNLDKVIDEYRQASLVVTNRLHSVIFSVLSETPVLVIGDDCAKLTDICHDFDIPLVRARNGEDATDAVRSALMFDRAGRGRQRQLVTKSANRNISAAA